MQLPPITLADWEPLKTSSLKGPPFYLKASDPEKEDITFISSLGLGQTLYLSDPQIKQEFVAISPVCSRSNDQMILKVRKKDKKSEDIVIEGERYMGDNYLTPVSIQTTSGSILVKVFRIGFHDRKFANCIFLVEGYTNGTVRRGLVRFL